MTNPIVAISGITIRQDISNRYSLKDLWTASGKAKRHAPNEWMRLQQTQELIDELAKSLNSAKPGIPGLEQNQPVKTIRGGNNPGTYVVRELVYSYAMWISPSFHLKVIRTFDAVMTGQQQAEVETLLPSEAQTLKEIVDAKLAHLPSELQRKGRGEVWSRVQRKFRANTYTLIPRDQLSKVILYITQMELRGVPNAEHTPRRPASEPLTNNDMANLRRVIWLISNQFHYDASWRNGIWYAIRQATEVPSPQRFCVHHLPYIEQEVRRIWLLADPLMNAIREAEEAAVKRVVRRGEAIEPFLAEQRQRLMDATLENRREFSRITANWNERELADLLNRAKAGLDYPEADEGLSLM